MARISDRQSHNKLRPGADLAGKVRKGIVIANGSNRPSPSSLSQLSSTAFAPSAEQKSLPMCYTMYTSLCWLISESWLIRTFEVLSFGAAALLAWLADLCCNLVYTVPLCGVHSHARPKAAWWVRPSRSSRHDRIVVERATSLSRG